MKNSEQVVLNGSNKGFNTTVLFNRNSSGCVFPSAHSINYNMTSMINTNLKHEFHELKKALHALVGV